MTGKALRCAIYTRKSSEDGLEQEFNSLDAQREACEAYIHSQAGEGWTASPTRYDDGGYSGGTMERPALRRLLADIEARKVDVIVVYKVDRLTRALSDFSRIVEILDGVQASFVSITQAFNSTTSMGRLTLNVLLSFAQFEREVTGERIRDKFAASKAKGMWMGGNVPFGYDAKDRALLINEAEAELIRRIFGRYLELKSVPALKAELEVEGVRTKAWISAQGVAHGGRVLSVGHLTSILKSRLYRGEIAHRGKVHAGQHQAIVVAEVWDAVQQQLSLNAARQPGGARQVKSTHLLTGLIFDDAGNPMSPTHARKGERRYRYYCSTALLANTRGVPGAIARLPAPAVDQVIRDTIGARLAPNWRAHDPHDVRVHSALVRIDVRAEGLIATVRRAALARPDAHLQEGDDPTSGTRTIVVTGPTRKRRGAVMLDAAMPARTNPTLVRAVVLARHWANELLEGRAESVKDIARRHGLCHIYLGKLMPLAFLAPDLVAAILDGRQPPGLSISNLLAKPLPFTWREQRKRFLDAG